MYIVQERINAHRKLHGNEVQPENQSQYVKALELVTLFVVLLDSFRGRLLGEVLPKI